MLADWMGRKPLMILSGVTFAASIPIIALSNGYSPLFAGRLLPGNERPASSASSSHCTWLNACLPQPAVKAPASSSGCSRWASVVAALIGIYYSYRVHAVELTASAQTLFHFKDHAWRRIFWVSLPPGLLFVMGPFMVSASPALALSPRQKRPGV
jgi:SP family myo-inositol transporter-like MFS transporter 13